MPAVIHAKKQRAMQNPRAGRPDPMMEDPELVLTGLRVIEFGDTPVGLCGRLLAGFGADVILVERPTGNPERQMHPMFDGSSLAFAVRNFDKRSVLLDPDSESDRIAFRDLLETADVVIDRSAPDDSVRSEIRELHAQHPEIVIVSITPFGLSGPYRDWAATDAVLFALSGLLSHCCQPGRPPLLPQVPSHTTRQQLWRHT